MEQQHTPTEPNRNELTSERTSELMLFERQTKKQVLTRYAKRKGRLFESKISKMWDRPIGENGPIGEHWSSLVEGDEQLDRPDG